MKLVTREHVKALRLSLAETRGIPVESVSVEELRAIIDPIVQTYDQAIASAEREAFAALAAGTPEPEARIDYDAKEDAARKAARRSLYVAMNLAD